MMIFIRLNRSTVWRNMAIGVLAVRLFMGESIWAGPLMNRPAARYPEPGKIYRQIPPDHHLVRVGPDQYIYREGVYYRREPKGFEVVRPPRGAVIHHLPLGFQILMIAGVTYFLFAGVYYQKTPSGYVVVDVPQEEASPEGYLSVNAAMLNVRSGPGMTHPVINRVRMGERLEIKGSSADWYYVRLPDATFGWVMSKYTRIMDPDAKG